ncbi:sialate O-acetylesterase [Aestuariibacter sp. GS-14]|uniref:sialate O-acetylesterase n=1 Tax=Aestuariibacter sp. GS-14 TaxID=2590670 RepID=UPI00112694E5|nr:sialate O-acetylesterase [Aestuariibacter sp. GS-14]TPV56436.1 sialate O-acetylesterase [Aestuariibacter sp. GS-14]
MRIGYLFLALLCSLPTQALTLNRLISDGAVLQRHHTIPLSGTTDAATVKVWLNHSLIGETTAHDQQWSISLPAHEAGGPYTLKIEAEHEAANETEAPLIIQDVYFGDVYLASGQSNMELPMARVQEAYPDDVNYANYPLIREFTVPDEYRFDGESQQYSGGQWLSATPAHIARLSAVAYYFARELHLSEGVPVGIVNASLGGSPIEAWMAREILADYPDDIAAGDYFANPSNIEATQQQEQAAQQAWYAALNEQDKGLTSTPWYTPALNDKDWQPLSLPGDLPGSEAGFAGVWWLRKHVFLAELPTEPLTLRLGRIVDADEAYVNGHKVGNTTYQYPPRSYTVPVSALQKGDNVIALRVISNGGSTGFVPDKRYYLGNDKARISLQGDWKYKVAAKTNNTPSTTFIRWKPMGLFNAMIAPATQFPISGVLWYQGESNASRPADYRDKLTAMISHWRARWQQPQLPFFIVQLTNFMQRYAVPTDSSWAQLRDQQYKSTELGNTALIVTLDIGEWNDIHPVNKKEVGRRIALAAKKLVYQHQVTYTGPEVDGISTDGSAVIISFSSAEGGLHANTSLRNSFAIAGEDGKFYWANARLSGDKVILQHPDVPQSVKVRYAWADNPAAGLYNRAGLPAPPFEHSINR